MHFDDNIELLLGFYNKEETHVWGGDDILIRVKDSRFKTLQLTAITPFEDTEMYVKDIGRDEYVEFKIDCFDKYKVIKINIFTNNAIFKIHVNKSLQPNIDSSDTDCRRLGLGIIDALIVEDELWKISEKIVVDKNYICGCIDNYYKRITGERDYRVINNFKNINGVILDIGANIGQSALWMLNEAKEINIHSYEPNKILEPNLELIKMFLNGAMQYTLKGVGTEDKNQAFFVPRVGDTLFTEEGSFVYEEVISDISRDRIRNCLQDDNANIIINKYEFELSPIGEVESYFIKIDTQGYELNTIKALLPIIKKYRPILLLEKGASIGEIMNILYDYKLYFYDSITNVLKKKDTNTCNYFLIHKDYTADQQINVVLQRLIHE